MRGDHGIQFEGRSRARRGDEERSSLDAIGDGIVHAASQSADVPASAALASAPTAAADASDANGARPRARNFRARGV